MSKGSGGTHGSTWRDKSRKELNLSKMTESGYYDVYRNGANEGKTIQGYMAHLMGKDKKPTLISSEQFESLKNKEGNIAIYRGFRRNEDANIQNYKTGDVYDGKGGVGEGSYFATQKLKEFSASGKYVEAILDTRKAKIADYQKLESQWKADMKSHKSRMSELRKSAFSRTEKDNYSFRREAYDDFGRWATAKGYDVVLNQDSRFTEYIIINRGILKVKK